MSVKKENTSVWKKDKEITLVIDCELPVWVINFTISVKKAFL